MSAGRNSKTPFHRPCAAHLALFNNGLTTTPAMPCRRQPAALSAHTPLSSAVLRKSFLKPRKENLAYSTENLLLNAYRQAQHGIPQLVQVDCTHRLVVEGHSCMLFGTVSTAQKLHIIGYAVCDKEDDAAHDHVFRSIKLEVERIVAERSRHQVKI